MHLVSFLKEQLREIRTVLPCYSSYQSSLHWLVILHGFLPLDEPESNTSLLVVHEHPNRPEPSFFDQVPAATNGASNCLCFTGSSSVAEDDPQPLVIVKQDTGVISFLSGISAIHRIATGGTYCTTPGFLDR